MTTTSGKSDDSSTIYPRIKAAAFTPRPAEALYVREAQAAVQAALAALVDRLGARSGALAQEAGSPPPATPGRSRA
ncbi:hypothetical protein WMF18_29115 [Sorangium sp. So ce315]|uniref:hypothetical protein n=1 Tax=Sorangium sp. So ce315 TaxID=3133299 RepID=UPI003F6467EA